jgi:hypothetical protein
MYITDQELELLEQLHHYGTPLDETVLREARAARRGLKIIQTGNCAENTVYATASGGLGILLSVSITNVSDRVIRPVNVRLALPMLDADFRWLKKPSSKELRERGGYVLSACGQCAFDPSEVLNHRFTRNSELHPGDELQGLLLGESTVSVPNEYCDGELIPIQLLVRAGRGDSYAAWLKLVVSRERQRPTTGLVGAQVQKEAMKVPVSAWTKAQFHTDVLLRFRHSEKRDRGAAQTGEQVEARNR